jgi:hypothetical protein
MTASGRVAFARAIFEALDVDDVDVPTPVADQSCRLQRARDNRQAGPAHPQHLREELLSHIEIIAASEIAGPQRPLHFLSTSRTLIG